MGMPKCETCQSQASVYVSWMNPQSGRQLHKVCDTCGQMLWNRIKGDFSGAEACASFSIEKIEDVIQ